MTPEFSCWIVSHAVPPALGGIEMHAFHVAKELAAKGHRVTLIAPNVNGPDAFWQPSHPPDNRLPQVPGGASAIRLPYFSRMERRLARFCKPVPEFIAVHFRLWLCRRAQKRFLHELLKMGRKAKPNAIVALPHLLPNVTAAARAAAVLGAPLVYLPCLHEHDPHWNVAVVSAVSRSARAVVALTVHEAGRLVSAYNVAPEGVFVSGHGVELPAKTIPPPTGNTPEILFIGRLTRPKGIVSLLEALPYAWQDAPKLRLHLLGADTPDVPELKRLAGMIASDHRDQVRFSINASDEQKSAALRDAIALVLPSKIESFGGVLIEAGAHARAAVAWDLPVFREIITDDQDGLLVPVDDIAALGRCLARLANDPSLCDALGAAARMKVERRFRWSFVARVYEQAIRFAIARHESKGYQQDSGGAS